jgi:protein-tyrosine phosphatase
VNQPSVLFVCLGNICRSPMAEAALRARAVEAGIAVTVDPPAPGTGMSAARPIAARSSRRAPWYRHIRLSRAQAKAEDFLRFSHIFALDPQDLRDLQAIAPRRHLARLELLMDLVPGREGTAVVDPYYGDAEDFERAWADVSAAADVLIERLGR